MKRLVVQGNVEINVVDRPHQVQRGEYRQRLLPLHLGQRRMPTDRRSRRNPIINRDVTTIVNSSRLMKEGWVIL